MWKDGADPWGCRESGPTGGVEGIGGFSTGAFFIHISPQRSHKRMWRTRAGDALYSYLALMLVVMSLTISAFSGSFFTRASIRLRALRTVL